MAEAKDSKKRIRKLRAAPTLREQAEAANTGVDKPSRKRRLFGSRLFAPVRVLGRLIKRLGLGIAGSRYGKAAASLYKSKLFWPVRFLVKVLSKVLFVRYFWDSWKELRLVIWPNAVTTWKSSRT